MQEANAKFESQKYLSKERNVPPSAESFRKNEHRKLVCLLLQLQQELRFAFKRRAIVLMHLEWIS